MISNYYEIGRLAVARAKGAAEPLTVGVTRPYADVRPDNVAASAKAPYPHVVGVEDFFA
jgi:hypothetical protein